ncbi:hypothetical protein BG015_009692 [Linnemannia schmuckeri]|uniref:Uncharacterized protein n=1 Tax=Linnemannia schmuckeri TaxID=64567 RepID=A0A9P5VEQ2_9FUNG|nr:hypothetical protein BG015_009692 [Linnemannia schmuckeri]
MQLFRRKVTTRQTPYGRPHKGPLEDPELESFLAADTDSNAATAEKLKKKVSKVLKRLWGSGNTKQEDHELQLDKENQPPFTNNNSSEEGKPLNQDQARKQSKKQGSKALQKLNLTISSHTAAQSQGMTGKKAYKPAGHQSRSTATYRVVGESTMMNRPYLVNSGMAMSRAASLSSKKKTPLGDTPSMNPVSSASKRAKKHVVQTIDASTTIGQSSKMIQTVNGHTEVLPLHVSGSGSIGLYHCMPEALATQRQNQSSRILSASETFDAAMEPRNQTQDCKRPRSPTSESEEACNLERPDDQDKHKNKMRPIASGSIAKVSIGTVEKNGIVITDTLDIARTASMPKPPTPVPKETNTHPDNRASSDLQKATMKAGAILSGSSNKGSHLYGGDLPSRPAIPTAPPASICLNSGTPSLHTAPLQKPFGTAAQPVVPLTAIAANICTALTKDSPAPSFVAQLQLSGSAATITTTPTTTTPTITVTTTPSSHTPPNSRPFATAATILEIPSPTASGAVAGVLGSILEIAHYSGDLVSSVFSQYRNTHDYHQRDHQFLITGSVQHWWSLCSTTNTPRNPFTYGKIPRILGQVLGFPSHDGF